MRCSYDSWTGNRRRRYLRRYCGYESEIFSECALTYSPKIEEKNSTNVIFRPIWPEISATLNFRGRPKPHFFTLSATYRPFLDEFVAFFSGNFLDLFCHQKKFGGVPAIFRRFWAFSAKTTNFRPNLPFFG